MWHRAFKVVTWHISLMPDVIKSMFVDLSIQAVMIVTDARKFNSNYLCFHMVFL